MIVFAVVRFILTFAKNNSLTYGKNGYSNTGPSL